MKFQFAMAAAPPWDPTDDDAQARVYQSDVGVTSSSSATRQRIGRMSTDLVAGATYGAYRAGPNPMPGALISDYDVDTNPSGNVATDGQGFLRLPSGRLILLGGAPGGHGFQRVNTIWCSDDKARTWSVLLPDDAPSATRPKPGHTLGFLLATFGGVPYVYWIGGDATSASGDVYRIPASALDVGGDPNTPWERMTTTAPTSAVVLFMYGQLAPDGDLFIIGGQTSVSTLPQPPVKKVYKSTNQGTTWTEVGSNIVPADVWGAQLGPLPVKNGKFWICGSALYEESLDPGDHYFSNAVYTFDGTTFELVLADGHTEFPRTRYHSIVIFNGRFWRFNGSVFDGTNVAPDNKLLFHSADGVTWSEVTLPLPWPSTHAQAVVATPDGVLATSGFQDACVYVVREHAGELVAVWEDQGGDALDLAQSDNAKKPIFDVNEFNGRGGLVFTKEQCLALAAKDAALGDGFFEIWIVAKTLSFDSSPEQGGPNPPCVFVGDTGGSSWNNFGILGPDGELQYKQVSGGYQPNSRGSGYNDDRPHLFGIVHQSGSLKFYVGAEQVGSTVPAGGDNPVGFDSTHTGWSALGAGYLEADNAEMVVGALVVRTIGAPSSNDFISRLASWAGRWGVAA